MDYPLGAFAELTTLVGLAVLIPILMDYPLGAV